MDNSEYLETDEVRLIKGITGWTFELPLVEIRVDSVFARGKILACLIDSLPQGIAVVVGNDLDVGVVTRARSRVTEVVSTSAVKT